MADAPTGISRALREAPPDRVVEAADLAIRSALGASGTAVYIADYRISGLWPVLDSRQVGAGGPDVQGTVQRCFSSQQPVRESGEDGRCRIHLPLTVWGERLGVLMVEVAGEPTETMVRAAVDMAGDLAMSLRARPGDRPLPAGPAAGAAEHGGGVAVGTVAGAQCQPRLVPTGGSARTGVHGGW